MSGRKGSKPRTERVVSRKQRKEEAVEEAALEQLVLGETAPRRGAKGRLIGDSAPSSGTRAANPKNSARVGKRQRAHAAWVDDDDAKVTVSLAGSTRLRKLRHDEEDDIVDGVEFQRRLQSRLAASLGGGEDDWAALPNEEEGGEGTAVSNDAKAAFSDDDDDGDDDDGDEADGIVWSTARQVRAAAGDSSTGRAAAPSPKAAAAVEASARRRGQRGARLLEAAERSTAALAVSSRALPPGTLRIRRVKDATVKEPARGVVTSVQFHPTGALLMAGSMDQRLRFFEADGARNRKVASVHFPDLPVMDARLSADGMVAYAVGRRPFFYAYDIPSASLTRVPRVEGRAERSWESFAVSPAAGATSMAFLGDAGDVVLVSTSTRQPVGVMRASTPARAAAFSPDGLTLVSSGGDGLVHVWDLRMQTLLCRFHDEGMQPTSVLAIAPGGDSLAVGSDSGIVNVYDWTDAITVGTAASSSASFAALSSAPAGVTAAAGAGGSGAGGFQTSATVSPRKVLTQLTTRVSSLCYNHDGSILASASRTLRDRVRLTHTASMTVFSNWPTTKTPLHYANCAAFSPTGDRLAVGNDRGRVLLWKLPHFDQ